MKQTILDILKAIADRPRTIRDLLNIKVGQFQLSETTMRVYAKSLIEFGFVSKSGTFYTVTTAGHLHLASLEEKSSERICNSSIREIYEAPRWESARPGADDHRQYRSWGV